MTMTRCERCASDLPDGLAAAYCPYCGQALTGRALAEPSPAVELLPPGAPDLPPQRPTFVLAPLPKRRVPAANEAPPPEPYHAPPPQPAYAPAPQAYAAPPPALAQPIEIHITQTQGSPFFGNCFTVLGVVVFLLVLLPLLCGLLAVIGSAGGAGS
jgi:hypothetical protein